VSAESVILNAVKDLAAGQKDAVGLHADLSFAGRMLHFVQHDKRRNPCCITSVLLPFVTLSCGAAARLVSAMKRPSTESVILSEAKDLDEEEEQRYNTPMVGSRIYCVYILTNKSGTLYVGVTGDIQQRIWQHKNKQVKGFTQKYNIDRLLYYETFHDVWSAIAREKQIKGWVRRKKLDMIASTNPDWRDLSNGWYATE